MNTIKHTTVNQHSIVSIYPMKSYIIIVLSMALSWASLSGIAQSLKIRDQPIVWDATRQQLSLEYLKNRHGIEQSAPYIIPRMVVVHWTAIPTLAGSLRAFEQAELPSTRKELIKNSSLNVSVAFLVDYDGTIYRLLPDTAFTRHCIGLNYMAVGIENVGDGAQHPLTAAQLEANAQIVRYLANNYPIEYLIGHHEYGKFRNTPLWKETNPEYFTHKTDPGEAFMASLRQKLKELNLKSEP